MKIKTKRYFGFSAGLLIGFILLTIALSFVDIQPIGPNGSSVGFATINAFIHNLTGINFKIYIITDWLGLVPVVMCLSFGLLGLIQLITRKKLLKVDNDILILGLYYIVVIVVYVLFEKIVINYRPVLIDGFLEVSYPSSTTLLVMTIMPTTNIQLNSRIKNYRIKKYIKVLITVFVIFMVVGRLISGVHWFTDIIGGALLSSGLVMMYYAIIKMKAN